MLSSAPVAAIISIVQPRDDDPRKIKSNPAGSIRSPHADRGDGERKRADAVPHKRRQRCGTPEGDDDNSKRQPHQAHRSGIAPGSTNDHSTSEALISAAAMPALRHGA